MRNFISRLINNRNTRIEENIHNNSSKKFMEKYKLYKKGSINKSELGRIADVSRPTVIK